MPAKKKSYAELITDLLRNSGQLDKTVEQFQDAIGGLSNIRRTTVYEYVAVLKRRIDILEALREADMETFTEEERK